ncbi:hypothetical protein [Burkholderia sp. Ac-20365]|uniref:hypothetical protein n=1 Tax=Burkholderia sp. Ac-20365 TaxID=2703897 RepID=UPI00197B1222|nr:hypothetical protein [Burkholderia sp. Ac-20365]MBN3760889.1 hypothetical protein [Burkholderia sp. Ac-20365]
MNTKTGTTQASDLETLDQAQRATLRRFASENGRRWKNALLQLWETGGDDRHQDGPMLRQIRIQFGPTFITRLTPKQLGM